MNEREFLSFGENLCFLSCEEESMSKNSIQINGTPVSDSTTNKGSTEGPPTVADIAQIPQTCRIYFWGSKTKSYRKWKEPKKWVP